MVPPPLFPGHSMRCFAWPSIFPFRGSSRFSRNRPRPSPRATGGARREEGSRLPGSGDLHRTRRGPPSSSHPSNSSRTEPAAYWGSSRSVSGPLTIGTVRHRWGTSCDWKTTTMRMMMMRMTKRITTRPRRPPLPWEAPTPIITTTTTIQPRTTPSRPCPGTSTAPPSRTASRSRSGPKPTLASRFRSAGPTPSWTLRRTTDTYGPPSRT
mmetsp:Transcript_15169/g.42171  ORF Transcript_15169/g.42171 Transcript_15169/m.42171 type:complete len:210 (-) Transcript_15169:669-1298(-)